MCSQFQSNNSVTTKESHTLFYFHYIIIFHRVKISFEYNIYQISSVKVSYDNRLSGLDDAKHTQPQCKKVQK